VEDRGGLGLSQSLLPDRVHASPYCSVFFYSDGACQPCVQDSCCAESKACSDDSECLLYWMCRRDCGIDAACKVACDATYWMGGGLNWVREYCLASQCATPCSEPARTCGAFDYSPAACASCMDQHCCAEGEACGTSADCAGVHMCMVACGADSACQDECVALGTATGRNALPGADELPDRPVRR